ncbi:MAG: hypothetical protein EOO10_26195, partial [Chitinophagaceae bacterium]
MNTNSTTNTGKSPENTSLNNLPFDQFITKFEQRLVGLFEENNDIHELSCQRGLPKSILKGIMDGEPLSVAIQQEYGGRGAHVKECLGVLAAASYQSLPLSLMFGINIALFLEPLAKYGEDEVKKHVLSNFVANQHMGGLMITEPAYGSDALNMKTFYQKNENGYHINGEKHWQGLTGMADYWLIAARAKDAQGNFKAPYDWSDVIQIDHSNPQEQQAMIDAMKYWVQNFDIDGFRADLAHLTPLPFWINARTQLSEMKHNLIWLAETEEIDYHEAFDISFTWRWMHAAEAFCQISAQH